MTHQSPTPPARARLLALDWGTTNLRASLLGPSPAGSRQGFELLSTRQDARGVMAVAAGGFETVLRDICGDWLAAQPGLPVIASGMVGSRQGWREAPYLAVPAGPAQAASALTVVELGTHRLHIVPGVSEEPRPGRFDVMRGEETQVWGCTGAQAGAAPAQPLWCLLPGTHSKWVQVDAAGCICRLLSYMTGELYALLSQHGTPGRLMVHGAHDAAAFAAGVALGAAEHAQLSHALFAARTAGLLGGVPGTALPDYLSGILIGAEIASAQQAVLHDRSGTAPAAPLRLIASPELCSRYGQALGQLGVRSQAEPAGATERGLWRVALAAGLISEEKA